MMSRNASDNLHIAATRKPASLMAHVSAHPLRQPLNGLPPPSWGRVGVGGIQTLWVHLPPPLTPPHKGEGDSCGAFGGLYSFVGCRNEVGHPA